MYDHSWSFNVIYFGICGKAIRDYILPYNNLDLPLKVPKLWRAKDLKIAVFDHSIVVCPKNSCEYLDKPDKSPCATSLLLLVGLWICLHSNLRAGLPKTHGRRSMSIIVIAALYAMLTRSKNRSGACSQLNFLTDILIALYNLYIRSAMFSYNWTRIRQELTTVHINYSAHKQTFSHIADIHVVWLKLIDTEPL